MIEYVSAFMIFAGSVFAVIGAIGHIRFPDVYTRAHPATKSSTIAVLITLTGALIYITVTQGFFSVRLLLGIFFVYLTAPVSSHLVLRAAYRNKVELSDITIEDALKDVIHGTPDDKQKEEKANKQEEIEEVKETKESHTN